MAAMLTRGGFVMDSFMGKLLLISCINLTRPRDCQLVVKTLFLGRHVGVFLDDINI